MKTSLTWKESGIVTGAGGALFMMACFGIGWSMAACTTWTTPVTVALAVVFITCGVFFYVYAIWTMRALRAWRKAHAGEPVPDDVVAASKRFRRNFGILFGTELLLIAIAIIACNVADAPNYITPLCVLIMGAHFIPFAWAYKRRFDYAPGVVAMATGIVGIVAIAQGADFARTTAMVSLVAAVCVIGYGFYDIWVIRKVTAK